MELWRQASSKLQTGVLVVDPACVLSLQGWGAWVVDWAPRMGQSRGPYYPGKPSTCVIHSIFPRLLVWFSSVGDSYALPMGHQQHLRDSLRGQLPRVPCVLYGAM